MATRAKRATGRKAHAKKAAPKTAKKTAKRNGARKTAKVSVRRAAPKAAKAAKPAKAAARKPATKAARKVAAKAGGKRAKKAPAAGAMAMTPPGAYVHMELYSDNPKATEKFYSKVFGWNFMKMTYGEGMSYTSYQAPGGLGGGIMDAKAVPMPVPPVLNYLLVEDVDKAAKKVEKAGGKLLSDKITVPGVGWSRVFQAPGGVVQALWQHNPAFMPPGK